MRVLLIEDQLEIREVQCMLLRQSGYTVDEAANADEARSALTKGVMYDIALIDLMIPGDNWDVSVYVEALRVHNSSIGIAFCSAMAGARQLAEQNNVSFIPKPFGIDSFLDTVKKIEPLTNS